MYDQPYFEESIALLSRAIHVRKQQKERIDYFPTSCFLPEMSEWITIQATDKKRVMRKRGKPRMQNPFIPSDNTMGQTTVGTNPALQLRTILEDSIQYLTTKTLFWKTLVKVLEENQTDQHRIQRMMCYGIGNFSQTSSTYYSASMWQLACAVALQRHLFRTTTTNHLVLYYDPCSTLKEINFVTDELGMQYLTTNDRGNHPVPQFHNTLFFMPHCPAQLYENVVWSNFSTGTMSDGGGTVWILGNSLYHVAEHNPCPCLQALKYQWETIAQLTQPTDQDCDMAPGNLYGAFNDTYVSRLPWSHGSEKWPAERPYETMQPFQNDGELL